MKSCTIICVSFYTTINKFIYLDDLFSPFEVNKYSKTEVVLSGKMIDTARMLASYNNMSSCLFGLFGKETGDEIIKKAENDGVFVKSFKMDSYSKSIDIIIDKGDYCTYFVTNTGSVHYIDRIELSKYILNMRYYPDYMVFGDELPDGFDDFAYADYVRELKGKTKVVVDCSGREFISVMKEKPFLLRIDKKAISFYRGHDVDTLMEALQITIEINQKSKTPVLCSMREKGSIYCDGENIMTAYTYRDKKQKKSSISEEAIFNAAYLWAYDFSCMNLEFSLKYATACAAAKTMTHGTELPNINDIEEFLKNTKVRVYKKDNKNPDDLNYK